jgi:signal transduction histidine kinase
MPDEVKVALYRIAQEAINNVVKHAQASRAGITLDDDGGKITLQIQDNGIGFNVKVQPQGLGLSIMHERAEDIDATLHINSQPDKGTKILVEWPAHMRE